MENEWTEIQVVGIKTDCEWMKLNGQKLIVSGRKPIAKNGQTLQISVDRTNFRYSLHYFVPNLTPLYK